MIRARGRRRPWATASAVMLASISIALTACAGEPPAAVPEPSETISSGARHGTEVQQPAPFLVRYGQTELRLEAVTYCYRSGCVDGVDENPPSVGSPEELFVFVPVPEFRELTVSQVAGGDPCVGRSVAPEVTSLGGGWWSVKPLGPADDYKVDLFASGQGSGDMVASLRWDTPVDRPLPPPTAQLTMIVDHDGVPDSYGLELAIGNLAETPSVYSATITATAANGRSHTFEASASGDCQGEGSLWFDEPDAEAKRAADLGDFPFDLRVELVLDGATYVGTATYPDDVIDEQDISVPLRFTPQLP